jgi:methylenetetrahydrofolate dehydrogenase (NADP+)/methenyltetrahydrofolate cyclohydrolase
MFGFCIAQEDNVMTLIDGKKIAAEVRQELKATISGIKGRKPALAVILVGEHPPSQIYIDRKVEACEEVGITSIRRQFPSSLSQEMLLQEIEHLNQDAAVDGILVQMPLPAHIDCDRIIQAISPDKDVDGFHPVNVGKMLTGSMTGFFPCTPLAIKTLLDRYGIDPAGRHAVVFGRSNIVGKPMAAMLMQSTPGGNATVTIVHRQSANVDALCRMGDILIVAIGQPKFISAPMVKEGAIVIDVGINRIACANSARGYQIVGDVDFDNVKSKCSYITPVPGGVGPMTIAMLLKNTTHAYLKRQLLMP